MWVLENFNTSGVFMLPIYILHLHNGHNCTSVDPFTSKTNSGCVYLIIAANFCDKIQIPGIVHCPPFNFSKIYQNIYYRTLQNKCLLLQKTQIYILDFTLLRTQIKNITFLCATKHIMNITVHNRSESWTQPVILSFPKKN